MAIVIEEWIKKKRCGVCVYLYIHTHGIHIYVYTHNGIHMYIRSFEDTWMDLEIVILSEVCQTQKDKCYMI